MRDLVLRLLSENHSEQEIHLFDQWHFLYLFIVFGGTLLLSLLFRSKSDAAKEKVCRILAALTLGLYVADFFLMPLSDSYNGISTDKLPFHICTLMGVMASFVQFSPKFRPIRTPVVMLGITASLMWMCYPGSALGGQPPFCYLTFQTFMFHGLLFAWGVLNLATGAVVPKLRHCWKELFGILFILLWASIGNLLYEHNWFFLRESMFAFIPDKVMPPVVVVSVFAVCMAVYGLYFAFKAIFGKKQATE